MTTTPDQMLIHFAVENFKSIRERQVLNLVASDDVTDPEGRRSVEVPGVGRVLKVAAIYGPNASGKSNLVDAWRTLANLAANGVPPGGSPTFRPFRIGDHWRGEPTVLEAYYLSFGVVWRYLLAVDQAGVVEEVLDRVHPEPANAFRRVRGGGPKPEVTWGGAVAVAPERQVFFRVLGEGTRQVQPVLAELRLRDGHELGSAWLPMVDMYEAVRTPFQESQPTASLVAPYLVVDGLLEGCERLLRGLSTGVEQVRLVVLGRGPASDLGLELADLQRLFSAGSVVMQFRHGDTWLALDELSSGTRRLVSIAPQILHERVGLSVFDELDRSFHTALSRELVSLWSEARGQLIFTTHDTNLLDADVLGADGIWFTEKDTEGATRLYSLAEFLPEELEQLTGHLEDGYLEGRFGALPFFGDPGRLGWGQQG